MTKFFPTNEWRSHEWKGAIEKWTNSSKGSGLFVASVFAGLGGAFVGGWPLGLACGAPLFLWGWTLEGKLGKCEQAAIEKGLIAPFLNEKEDFHAYVNGVGADRVRSEINQALENGYPIAPFAENWLNAQRKKPKENSDRVGKEQSISPVTAENKAEAEPTPKVETTNPFWEVAYAQLIILAGPQGSGKTTTLAKILEEKLTQGAFVVFCDPFYRAGSFWGVPVVGRTPETRYDDIAEAMEWFAEFVESRLRKQAKLEDYDPMNDIHVCFVTDEFTSLGAHLPVKSLTKFWEVTLQALRRLNLSVIIASHNLRKAGLGNKALDGKIETLYNQSQMFVLQTQPNRNGKPGSSPKIPGKEAQFKAEGEDEFVGIEVPQNFKPSNLNFDFRALTGKDKYPDWRKEVGIE